MRRTKIPCLWFAWSILCLGLRYKPALSVWSRRWCWSQRAIPRVGLMVRRMMAMVIRHHGYRNINGYGLAFYLNDLRGRLLNNDLLRWRGFFRCLFLDQCRRRKDGSSRLLDDGLDAISRKRKSLRIRCVSCRIDDLINRFGCERLIDLPTTGRANANTGEGPHRIFLPTFDQTE